MVNKTNKKKAADSLTLHRQKLALVVLVIAIALLAVGTMTGKMYAGSGACGNNACEVGETMASCPEDCVSICGDAICQPGEELTCPQDCTGDAVEAVAETVSLLDGILGWFR